MDKHVTAADALFIALGAQAVFLALIVLVAVAGGGLLSGDEEAMWITTSIVGLSIAGSFLLIEALKIVGGMALLRRPWARILVLILGFGSLFMIRITSAYGVYAVWVLMMVSASMFTSMPRSSRGVHAASRPPQTGRGSSPDTEH